MKMSWLIERYMECCWGHREPNMLRMGVDAYKEYIEWIDTAPRGRNITPEEKAFEKVKFMSCLIVLDPMLKVRQVQFGYTFEVPCD